ncbi:hypothetical protein D1164_10910 [Mariniphaga sediminis]|uniref:Uncharacterized protein n=2 Tax=Mariniphaga sediminis TaxID=1628158 RepID=A0A399D083_9BACT|nr:hypothetical protein D1164_10910 [Mariniphaga sediminis]
MSNVSYTHLLCTILKKMKQIISFIITLVLLSCHNSNQSKESTDSETVKTAQDTVLVKIENKIDKSYEIGFYSKSYTYCWIVGQDTLDLGIGLTEYVRDSSVQLRVFNQKPTLFASTINRINQCLPLIKEDFDMDNLRSLYFEPPIFYKDLTTELSLDYINQFGQQNIKHEELNEFLMNSWLEQKISNFLDQFGKTTRRYEIEKFHLLEKQYYNEYIPDSVITEYPEFSIHGMGISVITE